MKIRFGSIVLAVLLAQTVADAKLTQPAKGIGITYTVQSGDTLYSIAHRHHTTIREVLEANHLERNAVLRVGQVLKVPLDTYRPAPEMTQKRSKATVATRSTSDEPVDYTVQSGDTLFSIARKHHTSIRELLEANGLERNAVIKVGQHLRVPTNTYPPSKPKIREAKAPSPAPVRSAPKASSKDIYVVKPGDTLFSIARKNRIVLSKLMRINGIGLTTQLHAGQTLRITEQSSYVARETVSKKSPSKKARKLPVGAMPSYTVKKGDTLWGIAHKHHLTLAQIRKLNKMSKNDRIHVGTVLAVGKPIEAPKTTYTVQKGDTLWLIAKKNNMTTAQLRKLNGLKRRDRIHTGMVLALTKGAKLPAKTRKTGTKKKRPTQPVQTPLRIAKKSKTKKGKRFGSALAMLNGRSGGSSHRNNRVVSIAKRYLGRRYVWGATGPRTFDCSGFTQYVMRKSKGITLPRISRKQAYYGKYVSRSHLKPGDLVFFDTSRRRRGYVNHVGIYIGNNKFIHASSGKHRVVITSLNRPFYRSRFKWGRRVN
jgi:LysM repeat protein